MKHSKSDRFRKYRPIETLRFETEQQSYTAFGGLIVFQKLFAQLKDCFKPLPGQVGQSHLIMLTLIVHILLGYRALRDIAFYRDDPMVKRLVEFHHRALRKSLGINSNLDERTKR